MTDRTSPDTTATTNGYKLEPIPDGSGMRISDLIAGNYIDIPYADIIEIAEHIGYCHD